MPATPTRTKKALQELARTFNRLASDLTADLNEAIKEIETLRHEVRTLRSSRGTRPTSSKPSKQTASHKRSTGSRSTGTETGHPSTSHTTTTSTPEASFVFPHEPFNPPAPPEPQVPGNN